MSKPRVVPPSRFSTPPTEQTGLTYAQRKLGAAATHWRKDVVGFQSKNLLILTSTNHPGAIARCISRGELVCAALADIFRDGEHDRGARDPMVLYLYETKDEYLRESGGGKAETGTGLAMTAGHYSLTENVSRIFLPDGVSSIEEVMETYAHEVTHHWLRMRCPLFPFRSIEPADLANPGHWVVEGFASFVEEFHFDQEAWTWDMSPSQSRRRDLVANAKEGQTLAWKTIFGLSKIGFHNLKTTGEPEIPSRSLLGTRRVVTGRHMYYAQAAATCHYLYVADNGKHRALLLEFLKSYYTGDSSGVALADLMGLSDDEIGAAVVEHARKTMGM